MTSQLNPYVHFDGNARTALEAYREILGGELTVTTFGEYGMDDPAFADRLMHGQLVTDLGLVLMGADTPPGTEWTPGGPMAVSISGDDAEQLRGYFPRLADGGVVEVPLEKQMWGDEFGACTDRFGVSWMVNVTGG